MESPMKKGSDYYISTTPSSDIGIGTTKLEENEVFATGEGGVNFRNVGWIKGRVSLPALWVATNWAT